MFEWAAVFKLMIFIFLIPVVAALTPLLLGKKGRLWRTGTVFFLSGILGIASLLWLNNNALVDDSETTIMKHLSSLDPDDILAYQQIDKTFLFVDNSFNKTLIPYDEGTDGDSTTLAITDRRALISLIRLLNAQIKLVDLVVYDIALETATPQDQNLKNSLDTLVSADKLLISYQPLPKDEKLFRFPSLVYGNVRETFNGSAYTSHTIDNGTGPLSLAYKMHAKLGGIQSAAAGFANVLVEKKANGTHWRKNVFIPKFRLLNEGRLYDRALFDSQVTALHSRAMPAFVLGQMVTPLGRQTLINEMKQRKARGEKNIIFLGSFKSPTDDIHPTAYGDLHGPTIILNVFYALSKGANELSLPFLLVLILVYLIVHYMTIDHVMSEIKLKNFRPWFHRELGDWQNRVIDQAEEADNDERKKQRFRQKAGRSAFHTLFLVLEFLFEKLHYFLLLLSLYLIGLFSRTLLNGTIIILYFVAFEAIIKYFGKHKLNRHNEP